MKKKKLIERLNKYFSAEENKINIPPVETIRAYNEFHTLAEPAAAPPVRRSVRHLRRAVMIAACLAVAVAVAIGIAASIGEPESTVSETPESNDGFTNEQSASSPHLAVSDELGEPSEGVISEGEGPIEEVSGAEIHEEEPDSNGNGMGGGGGEAFERYYSDEFYNLYSLSYLVTWDEIYAAESKLFAENEYFRHDQLPPLYVMIRELNISKEDFIQVRDEHDLDEYTDADIEWLFSDADMQTIQSVFKLDTALLYNGRLYTLYELLELDASQLRKMADTDEMNAYLADLDAYLEELERKALAEENAYYHPAQTEWEQGSELVERLKGAIS